MAIKDLVDKALLSAFWGSASEKIDARIAAAKASAATASTAGLVKPGSGLAVASDGTLSAKVDGATIGLDENGRLANLAGGGLTPFSSKAIPGGETFSIGNWKIKNGKTSANHEIYVWGAYGNGELLITSWAIPDGSSDGLSIDTVDGSAIKTCNGVSLPASGQTYRDSASVGYFATKATSYERSPVQEMRANAGGLVFNNAISMLLGYFLFET